MLRTEIRREVRPPVFHYDEPELRTLATKAKEELGYGVLEEVIVEGPPTTKPILAILHGLDVEPFNIEDVKTYMLQEMQRRSKELFEEWLKNGQDVFYPWNTVRQAHWKPTLIGQYTEAIPERVLQLALKIQAADPEGVELIVYSLEESTDPFLAVQQIGYEQWRKDHERYFIDVWDEPGFQGTLRPSDTELA